MPKTLVQKITFKNVKPSTLYKLYMDEKQHEMIAGSPCKIPVKEGAKYSAHGGYITGTNLQLVKNNLIVQSWKANDWNEDAVYSTLTLYFEPKGDDTMLYLTHANLPDEQYTGIARGWHEYYWNPWKQHLAGKKPRRIPAM
jgi:activator of HSP90 ATPase